MLAKGVAFYGLQPRGESEVNAPMWLKKVIAAPKSAIKVGPWRSGKVPRSDFPLARKAYGLGSSYQWCVVTFQALGNEFRVLIVLNDAKQKYEAVLGVMTATALRILCSYEWHASEPGWHCHAVCGDASKIPLGVMRGPWIRRIPRARQHHRQQNFGVDLAAAIRIAIDCYNIEEKGALL